MTTTSMRTLASLEALDALPQGLTTASACYPADADTQMSAAGTQLAPAGYMAPLAYSEAPDDDALGTELGYNELSDQLDEGAPETARRLFLLVGSALTLILAVGAAALVISLALGVRPIGDRLPSSGEAAIFVPNSQTPVPAASGVWQPPPIPPGANTVQEPAPVVQQAPRTVYTTPTPGQQAPPAVATPPAAPAPVPPPEDPAPAPDDPVPAPQLPDVDWLPLPPRAPKDPRPPVAFPPIIPVPNPHDDAGLHPRV